MPNETAITIDGEDWRDWETFRYEDSISKPRTLTFGGPWDPNREDMREAYKPLLFKDVELKINGEVEFSGQMLDPQPDTDEETSEIQTDCYAHCAPLQDNTAPPDSGPFEFNDVKLDKIAEQLAGTLDVEVVFDTNPGEKFDRVKYEPDSTIWDFLQDLAKQRNLLMGSDAQGRLLFRRALLAGAPVDELTDMQSPVIGIKRTGNPRKWVSEVTPLAGGRTRRKGSKHTEKNPLFSARKRPLTFRANDSTPNPVLAATSKLSRIYGACVGYTVQLNTWYDAAGDLWRPNTIVSVEAPFAMIYKPTKFLIRQVVIEKAPEDRRASLVLALPGTFGEALPGSLPWD